MTSQPKSHDASFGDEVLVIDNSVGCPTEEVYEKWLNTVLEKGDEVALDAALLGGWQNWSTATRLASSSR
jgi:hypothetical protein